MTTETEPKESARIQAAIAKAETERAELTEALDILEDEQRKAATLATVGLLSESKAARLREIPGEIATAKARRDQLATGIEGARELLAAALAEEAAAQAKADWDEAEALLTQALDVAKAAQAALEEAGAKYSELTDLIDRAVTLGRQHVHAHLRYGMASLGENLELAKLFPLVLSNAGGPNNEIFPTYVSVVRPRSAPTIEAKVAECTRRLAEMRAETRTRTEADRRRVE
ncbi:hypothetical protein [Azospirillum brasilense]|uniref:Uncharacterized protein n=1 Tax=Azospirillum brasilense TaxID=192 RepID=A0A6L3B633_AZOBR|nr:hypothetical protein [Azospirillum brasilense]KAA0688485.1 hypothetical protein DS837_01795 [Azospirillum brasilense]